MCLFICIIYNAMYNNNFKPCMGSAPQAHAWLKVQPSPKLGLALMPDEEHRSF